MGWREVDAGGSQLRYFTYLTIGVKAMYTSFAVAAGFRT